jgi:hypothetical protein
MAQLKKQLIKMNVIKMHLQRKMAEHTNTRYAILHCRSTRQKQDSVIYNHVTVMGQRKSSCNDSYRNVNFK